MVFYSITDKKMSKSIWSGGVYSKERLSQGYKVNKLVFKEFELIFGLKRGSERQKNYFRNLPRENEEVYDKVYTIKVRLLCRLICE